MHLEFDGVTTPIGRVAVAMGPEGALALFIGAEEGRAVARLAAQQGATLARAPTRLAPVLAEIVAYLAGEGHAFTVPLTLTALPPFDQAVLAAVAAIPYGQTRTYGQIARAVGQPEGSQAVGQAVGRNPLPLLIPCHRVIGAGNRLGGYSAGAGVATKLALLRLEGSLLL